MNFYTTVLGTGAAVPALGRHCSSQVVSLNGMRILLDCGESTQEQMRRFHQKMQATSLILISHLHGDHVFGLPGLLSSMHLCGRTEPIDIVSPRGLQNAINPMFEYTGNHLQYEVRYHELDFDGLQEVFSNAKCSVKAFPLHHSVPTYGYLIEEKLRNPNATFSPGRYAYCCDTAYLESIVPYIRNVDLLCMESTYASDCEEQAGCWLHCTASQAASIARMAEVKKLMLTHFSARYKGLNVILDEACSIFPETILAAEGEQVAIR